MTVVSRLYDNYSDATRAVSELERAGIPHSDISIVANNAEGWYSEDGGAVNRGARADRDGRIDRDRKSTRLNSSHRCISYAVFCLKKKNNIHTSTLHARR